jgi:large subunit ribosomal protein L31e
MAEEIEKIYVIPLRTKGFKTSVAAPTAVKRVKNYLIKHMKVEAKDIWIDDSLNNSLWSHGKYKMPIKIRVKAVKFDDGVVEVYLPELEFKKSRREILKEEKAKKEPILIKEEKEIEEEPIDKAGTEDYEVTPTADGEVKIKKKKTPKTKEKKETKEEDKKIKEKPKKKEEISDKKDKSDEVNQKKVKEKQAKPKEKTKDQSKPMSSKKSSSDVKNNKKTEK